MNVLVFESECLEREMLRALLEHEGLSGRFVADEASFIRTLAQEPAEMAIVSLYDGDSSLRLCRQARQHAPLPLLALTNKPDEDWLTQLYEAGVDEVLGRPIAPRLLIARIENMRRRSQCRVAAPAEDDRLAIGPFKLYPALLELRKNDLTIRLTPLQARLLYHLMSNAGQIVSKSRLEDKLWGEDASAYGDLIKTHICHLRRKLEDDPRVPCFIETVKGIGYRFQKPIHN